MRRPEVVVICGGTGAATLLPELQVVSRSLSVVVNTFDSGGSSETIGEEYDMPSPGDLTQCSVATGNAPAVQRIAAYRFARGPFKGHTVGNIMLAAMVEDNGGCIEEAIAVNSEALGVTGNVIPIVTDRHTLVMRDGGTTIRRESEIGRHHIRNSSAHVELDPPAQLNPRATEAIARADLVYLAQGDPYTSLHPCMAVGGMPEALRGTNAKIVAGANLLTIPGHTDGWHVANQVHALERYIGKDVVDYVIYNNDVKNPKLLAMYDTEDEYPVRPVRIDPERLKAMHAVAIGAPLVAKEVFLQNPNDTKIKRSQVRHDGVELCKRLMSIFYA